MKFSSNFTTPQKRSSVLTQSVPNFSSALWKENRKPVALLSPMAKRSVMPPAGLWKSGKIYEKGGGGSKSANSAEKRSGGLRARKSYANMEELKRLAAATGNAIKIGGGNGKSILGYRQF